MTEDMERKHPHAEAEHRKINVGVSQGAAAQRCTYRASHSTREHGVPAWGSCFIQEYVTPRRYKSESLVSSGRRYLENVMVEVMNGFILVETITFVSSD